MEGQNPLAPYEGQFTVQERKNLVAKMIRECRKAKALQQKDVAEILGVSPQTYNGYEKGRNEPPIEMLVRLSFLFQVPLDMLVQKNRFHKADESEAETVKKLNDELADIRQSFASSPLAENEQLQKLLSAMETLTDTMSTAIEKKQL